MMPDFLLALALALAMSYVAVNAAAAAPDASLRDHPIASAAGPLYLDSVTSSGAWTAWTMSPTLNMTIPASVPGDLLTDLQHANVIADPWPVPCLWVHCFLSL